MLESILCYLRKFFPAFNLAAKETLIYPALTINILALLEGED
jgi:hypothetical protein